MFSLDDRALLATAATVMLACIACFEPGGVASEPPQPVGGNTPAPAVFNDKIPTLGRMPEAPARAGRTRLDGWDTLVESIEPKAGRHSVLSC